MNRSPMRGEGKTISTHLNKFVKIDHANDLMFYIFCTFDTYGCSIMTIVVVTQTHCVLEQGDILQFKQWIVKPLPHYL